METKEQRMRRKFRRVVDKAPEFMDLDKKKLTNLLCEWFVKNKREIVRPELEVLIKKCKK